MMKKKLFSLVLVALLGGIFSIPVRAVGLNEDSIVECGIDTAVYRSLEEEENPDIPVLGGKSDFSLTVTGQACYELSYQIHEKVNEERTRAGLAPLAYDEELVQAAMQRAAECIPRISLS